MLKSNCHTHTNYCDGNNSAREMVDAAVNKGFISLGFSAHSPMSFKNDWAMKSENIKNYIDEINALKVEYKDKIDILCGIEVDSDYCGVNFSAFDYTIGSVHQFHGDDEIFEIDYSTERLKEAIKKLFDADCIKMCSCYYNLVADFICKNNFDVVGHFDLVTKFNEKDQYIDESDPEYRRIALEAIDRILKKHNDIIFEVNTGAMYRCGNTKPYPAPFIMEHLFKNGANITITSDAHCCEALDYAFDEAIEYCKSFGFRYSHIFTSGGIKKVEL